MTAAAPLDPVYYTDDYPRAGCTISIAVPTGRDGLTNFSVGIAAPNGQRLESYTRDTLDEALEAARCLATGERVPA